MAPEQEVDDLKIPLCFLGGFVENTDEACLSRRSELQTLLATA